LGVSSHYGPILVRDVSTRMAGVPAAVPPTDYSSNSMDRRKARAPPAVSVVFI
jgi:hypothetical protein